MLQTKVKLLCFGAQIPNRAYQGDAGYDLTAVCDVIIPARGIAEVSIGIALVTYKEKKITVYVRFLTQSCFQCFHVRC